jgi:hypothetical protein
MPVELRPAFRAGDVLGWLVANVAWFGAWWVGALGYAQLVLLLALECLLVRALGLLLPSSPRRPWWIEVLLTLAQLALLLFLAVFAWLFAADAVHVGTQLPSQQRTLATMAACLVVGSVCALTLGALAGDARAAFERSLLRSACAAFLTLATLPFVGVGLWLLGRGAGSPLPPADFEAAMIGALFVLKLGYELHAARIGVAHLRHTFGLEPQARAGGGAGR